MYFSCNFHSLLRKKFLNEEEELELAVSRSLVEERGLWLNSQFLVEGYSHL
jgi:hypothetical protein